VSGRGVYARVVKIVVSLVVSISLVVRVAHVARLLTVSFTAAPLAAAMSPAPAVRDSPEESKIIQSLPMPDLELPETLAVLSATPSGTGWTLWVLVHSLLGSKRWKLVLRPVSAKTQWSAVVHATVLFGSVSVDRWINWTSVTRRACATVCAVRRRWQGHVLGRVYRLRGPSARRLPGVWHVTYPAFQPRMQLLVRQQRAAL
jgi:hypothetical protein